MVYVAQGNTCSKLEVRSNGVSLGFQTLKPGYNTFVATGVTAGSVLVQVTDCNNKVSFSGNGPQPVHIPSFFSVNPHGCPETVCKFRLMIFFH